jgi:hypothetical protein
VSSASLILTDCSLALSEPKAVGAQGSTKVLAETDPFGVRNQQAGKAGRKQ